MRKWLFMFGLFGAGWMAFVLYLGSWLAVTISNYPGQLLAQWALHWWARDSGGSPDGSLSGSVWVKIWLVLTSALEWVVVGFVVLAIVQRVLQRRSKSDVEIE